MQSGGNVNPVSLMSSGANLINQLGSSIGDLVGLNDLSDEGFMDPKKAFGQGLLKNIALGPLSFIGAFGAKRKAKKYNEELERQHAMQREAMDPTRSSYNPYVPIMQDGGMTSDVVELEKGEVYRTPDGKLYKIPDSAPSHAQGGVITQLPSGTDVLGKLRPGGDKTYKQLGSKLKKLQNKYEESLLENPVGITSNTAGLMLNKIQRKFDDLFEDQQIQNGGENNMEEFAKGGKWIQKATASIKRRGTEGVCTGSKFGSSSCPPGSKRYNLAKTFRKMARSRKGAEGMEVFAGGGLSGATDRYPKGKGKTKAYPMVKSGDFAGGGRSYPIPTKADAVDALRLAGLHHRPDVKAKVYHKYPSLKKGQGGMKILPGYEETEGASFFTENPQYMRDFQSFYGISPDNIYGPETNKMFQTYGKDYTSNLLTPVTPISGKINQGNPSLPMTQGLTDYLNTIPTAPTRGFDFSNIPYEDIFNTGATLAPIAYNISQGLKSPTRLNARDFQNPYISDIRNTLKNRKFNINPILERNRLAQSTYNYGVRQAAPSKARYLANLQTGQAARQRADAEAIAQKQNVENQYLRDQALFDMYLGKDIATTRYNVADINLRNEAARRKMMGAGLSGIQQYAQQRKLMKNMTQRDKEKLALLSSLIPSLLYNSDLGFTFKD
jgi:hypothetical protein